MAMHNNDDKQIHALAQRILSKAGWKLGGASLSKYLGVPDITLSDWLAGRSLPPPEVILKAVQLLDLETGAVDIRTAPPPD